MLTCNGGKGQGKEGMRVKLASHSNWIINLKLPNFSNLLGFLFPLFDTLKSVSHYF